MALAPPISGEALARGLRNEFRLTWQKRFRGLEGELGRIMQLALASDKIEELYGFGEPPAPPRRRPWGDEVHREGFRFRNFTVENVAWDASVEWFKHQRLFDQLKDLDRLARQSGEEFAEIPERVAAQIVQATVDPDLLDIIPNAPDGVAIYSAVDGDGADRFGVTGGNVLTGGAGIGSSDAIRQDTFNALERKGSFLTPKGQPAISPRFLTNFTIWFPITLWEVMLEAFRQTRTLDGGAALTNVTIEAGLTITLLPSPRIVGTTRFQFLDQFEPKPLFEQIAQPLDEQVQVEGNSDVARRQKLEGIFWETIRGYGVNLPLGTMSIAP